MLIHDAILLALSELSDTTSALEYTLIRNIFHLYLQYKFTF